jgi:hypothetical protein
LIVEGISHVNIGLVSLLDLFPYSVSTMDVGSRGMVADESCGVKPIYRGGVALCPDFLEALTIYRFVVLSGHVLPPVEYCNYTGQWKRLVRRTPF